MKSIVTTGALAVALVSAAPVFAQPGPPDFTGITLPQHALRGQQAIDAIGPRINQLANWYGKSAEHLKFMFRNDHTMALDRAGRILFIEDKPANAATTSTSPSGTIAVTGNYTTEQAFQLHSKPGATRILYLDFNGFTAQNTVWNSSYGLSTINAAAFDLDGDPSTFSVSERQTIMAIWQRVAEDYAPFNVDVTTQEPTSDQLAKTSSSDTSYGWRAVITRDWTQQSSSPCGCGGFSYIGVFTNQSYTPSWIFYDQLAYNDKYIGDAVSHEVGHALGLSHDGTSSSAYYYGQGSGTFSWAPIMGVGYYSNLVQWSKGDYPNANNTEDDIAIIAQNLPLSADDVADSYAQSMSLTASTANGMTTLSATGNVGTASDVDVFNFYSSPGTVTFNITGVNPGTDAKLYAEVRDGAGNILVAANPPDSTDASVAVNVPAAGQYYLVVTSVGYGDWSSGFPEYGSLGQYTVAGTAPAMAGVPPVAVAAATPSSGTAPLAVTLSANGSYDPDGSIVTYEWNFGDGSPLAYGASVSHSYAAGSYSASLRVVDNSGFSSSATTSITATQAAVAQQTMSVGAMSMSVQKQKNGTFVTTAVTVRDGNGNPLPNATVTGSWAGKYSGSGSATTGSNGVASIKTGRMSGNTGSVTFTVNAVSESGYNYTSSANAVSVDTISW